MNEVVRRRKWAAVGSVLAFLGVAAGAFGAHALRDRLNPEMLKVFEVAVRYQLVHSLALVILGTMPLQASSGRAVHAAAWFFLTGIVLFSGSLYALAVTGFSRLGAVTPFGGVAFLLGWASLILVFFLRSGVETPE